MHGKRMISIDRHDYSLRCVACVCVWWCCRLVSCLSSSTDTLLSLSLSRCCLDTSSLMCAAHCRSHNTQGNRKKNSSKSNTRKKIQSDLFCLLAVNFSYLKKRKKYCLYAWCVCVWSAMKLWLFLLLECYCCCCCWSVQRQTLCVFLYVSFFFLRLSNIPFSRFFFCVFFFLSSPFFSVSVFLYVIYLVGWTRKIIDRDLDSEIIPSVTRRRTKSAFPSVLHLLIQWIGVESFSLSLSVYVCVMHRINNRRVVQKGCAHPPYHHHGQTSECIEAQHLSLFTHCSFPLQHCPCV